MLLPMSWADDNSWRMFPIEVIKNHAPTIVTNDDNSWCMFPIEDIQNHTPSIVTSWWQQLAHVSY